MQDLNATMFYKARFTATSNEPSVDLLWTLICEIRNWLRSKWNRAGHTIIKSDSRVWTRFKLGGKVFDEEKSNHVYGESAYHVDEETNSISWACKIVEKQDPKEGYAQREWTTEIGYQSIDNTSATISYVVTYNDMPGFIGFCEETPTISVPRIIRSLLTHSKITCWIGATRLSIEPTWLNPGDYPEFEKVILDPDRELPIIYISPYHITSAGKDDNQTTLLVDPSKLANSVAANALVYCSNNAGFASEMRWYIDSRYGCPGGAIRVYRPKINLEDANDHYKHRFILASFIQEHGEEAILDIFRRAFAQDVHYYETMFRLDSCKELLNNDVRKRRLAALRANSETLVDEAYQEYLIESEKREEAERLARIRSEELDRAKSDNYNLQIQLESLRETANQASQISAASQMIRSISEYPNTPQAIAKYFETVYPERIFFTERAYRSMGECVTRSEFLWEVFYHMAVDLYDLLHENAAQAFKLFSDRTGWECARGMGNMTRQDRNLMKLYYDSFEGQEINIEAHIKNGNKDSDPRSVRVYFAYDPQVTDKIIVGHCGKHIDNYSTRKVK